MTRQEQLDHERHVADILRIRDRSSPKSSLDTWLNSNVLTAIVGVVGTAVLGAWVSGVIQERSKENELEQKKQEAKVEAQRVAVQKVLERAGTFLNATDDLLVSINVAYSERDRPPHEVDTLRKWKIELTQRRDAADADWRREKRILGFTVHYLFDASPTVTKTWRDVVRTVDAFEVCTNQWYTDHAAKLTTVTVENTCPEARDASERAIETFTAAARNHNN